MTSVGVITIVSARGGHLSRMAGGILRQTRVPECFVVMAMDGGGPGVPGACVVRTHGGEGPLPLARVRNLGARHADCEFFIFLDVDCIPEPDVLETYVRAYERHGPGLFSGDCSYLPPRDWSSAVDFTALRAEGAPHPSRPRVKAGDTVASGRYDLAWTVSLAIDRQTFCALGGFDERFRGYGAEDTDFTERARRARVPLWRVGCLVHRQSHPVSRPRVEHLEDIARNAVLLHEKHGWTPMRRWLREFEEAGLIETDERNGRLNVALTGHRR